MPIKAIYDTKKKKWVVINSDTGEVFGTHPNKESADEQVAAMAVNDVDVSGEGEE